MPMECFGYRQLPRGAMTTEKATRHGGELVKQLARGDALSQNERDYLRFVIEFFNAVLWEQTALPDFIDRGIFDRDAGELAYRMSMFWLFGIPADERVTRLRRMRDAIVQASRSQETTDDIAVYADAAQFLSNVNATVSRIYNV